MEIRRHVLIFVACVVASLAEGETVRRYPLDDRTVYMVRVSEGAPTTILFPGEVTALEGANVSSKPEDNPAVLLAHTSGSNFFSVRANRPDAVAGLNVVYRGKLIALSLKAEADPDRTITFFVPDDTAAKPTSGNPSRWFTLLDQAKRYRDLAEINPGVVQAIERIAPEPQVPEAPARVDEAFRFAADRVVVARIRVENREQSLLRIVPARVRLVDGERQIAAALTEISGPVRPDTAIEFWAVFVEDANVGPLSEQFTVEVR